MAMVKSGWLHRQSKWTYTTCNKVLSSMQLGEIQSDIVWCPVEINSAWNDYIYSFKAQYFVDGNGTGLTCGPMGDSCFIMINNGVTWRMIFTWGLTALTSATPLLVEVLINIAQWLLPHSMKPSFTTFLNVGPLLCAAVLLLRAEPTRGEDARRLAPDSMQRWTSDQPVCRQRRWCSVRGHIHPNSLYYWIIIAFYCPSFSMVLGELMNVNVLVWGFFVCALLEETLFLHGVHFVF